MKFTEGKWHYFCGALWWVSSEYVCIFDKINSFKYASVLSIFVIIRLPSHGFYVVNSIKHDSHLQSKFTWSLSPRLSPLAMLYNVFLPFNFFFHFVWLMLGNSSLIFVDTKHFSYRSFWFYFFVALATIKWHATCARPPARKRIAQKSKCCWMLNDCVIFFLGNLNSRVWVT